MLTLLTDLFLLTGKTAIVTGASRGLGRAISTALNGAGADVLLVSRDVEGMKETQAGLSSPERSSIYQCDVADQSQLESFFDLIPVRYSTPDILVNNAGIIRRNPAVNYTTEDWDDVLNTNLRSVFILSREAGKRMIVKGSGKIINIASVLSFSGGFNVVAYAASKGGVAQLTKALANEWAKHNVNVNAITPGYFTTDATEALRADPDRAKYFLSRIPQGRWGEPSDLAGAAIFLASRASDYVNGHILCVDGGWNSF